LTGTPRSPRRRASQSASIAALLSFIWPGLGQLYLGRPRAAAAFAGPLVVVALIFAVIAREGLDVFVVRLLAPGVALPLILVLLATAAWRLASMADAFLTARGHPAGPAHARRPGPTWRTTGARRTFSVLVVAVVLTHGVLIGGTLAIARFGNEIFVGDSSSGPSLRPGQTGEPQLPHETPYVTPKPGGWINTLLIGADSGMGYDHALTDTMIVVSANREKGQIAMFSFPRDIARFPMYDGGVYDGKLNSLMTQAAAHPDQYPDGGLGTLSRELGYLLGTPIHYYAYVNLAGFKALIDEVGGVDVVNGRDINDATYQFPDGKIGFYLSAGPHHLDGRTALAFVRSRQGTGDNDFTRARRQQQLLIALRAKLTDPGMLPRLPAILDVAGQTVQTNYPPDQAADLLALSKALDGDAIEQIVLGPPYAVRPEPTTGTYILVIDEAKFSALSIRLFGDESRYTTAPASPVP